MTTDTAVFVLIIAVLAAPVSSVGQLVTMCNHDMQPSSEHGWTPTLIVGAIIKCNFTAIQHPHYYIGTLV